MNIARLIACAFLLLLAAGAARAEITLTPLRQVITEQHRIATYRVSNPSRRIVEGRVSWVDLAATETGYAPASAAARDQMSAAPFLTVSPAFFRLEPGANTTITVRLRDGAKPQGERRSHLVIETGATRTPLRKASQTLAADIGLAVSTPVIMRIGAGKAAAKIGATRLLRNADGLLELETMIEPQGPFSAYGRVDVMLTPAGGAHAPRLLKRIDNIAAYIDAPRRRISAPLGVKHLPAGVLDIRFVGGAEFDEITFARRAFELAPPG